MIGEIIFLNLGLAKLASVYQETPNFGGADTVDDVSTQIANVSMKFVFE